MQITNRHLGVVLSAFAVGLGGASASADVVGNPGPITISIEHVQGSIGGALLGFERDVVGVTATVTVAKDGSLTWTIPAGPLSGSVPIAGQAVVANYVYDYSGQIDFVVTPTAALSVHVDPHAGTAEAVGAATVSGSGTLVIQFGLDSVACSFGSNVSLDLRGAYDPVHGTATLVDAAFAVPATPTCSGDQSPLGVFASAMAPIVGQQVGLPASSGASHLSLRVGVSPAPLAPRPPTVAPTSVQGPLALGTRLTCALNGLTGLPVPETFSAWFRDGVTIGSAPNHVVAAADLGHRLTCSIRATNVAGTKTVTAPARLVPTRCVVPPLAGRTLTSARSLLAGAGCRLRVRTVRVGGRGGRVVRSTPASGARLANGAVVTVDVRR